MTRTSRLGSNRPTTSIFGREAYGSLDDKAAVPLESIIRSRALLGGNKRRGWLAVIVCYGLNADDMDGPDDEAYDRAVPARSTRECQRAAQSS